MTASTTVPGATAAHPRVTGVGPWAHVAGRAAATAAGALVLAALVLPWRPATLCFLRAVTGVPCPFCGSTTAMVQLGSGRPLAALAASPLATVAAPLWVLWPVVGRHARRGAALLDRRRAVAAVAVLLTASWAWQVVRFFG